ncbi:MAG: hypothetical protein ACLPZF_12535, partial [Candidatus Acidiferrales bacterium]
MSRGFLCAFVAVVLIGVAVDGHVLRQRREVEKEFQNQVTQARAEAERIREQIVLPTANKLPAGRNFAMALQRFGLSSQEAGAATVAAERAFNLRQLRAGNPVIVGRSVASPASCELSPNRSRAIAKFWPAGNL